VAVFRYGKLEWIANTASSAPRAAKDHRWLPARRASSRAAAIFNAGRMDVRALGCVAESDGLVTATTDGLRAAGEVPPAPSTPAERLSLWCGRWPSPAIEMLRWRAAQVHGCG
jgi:hypothetical protein